MKIILVGMKGAGKTTAGRLLAHKTLLPFVDSDAYIQKMHEQEKGEALSPNDIIKHYGGVYFSSLETKALKLIAQELDSADFVLACGGRTPLPLEKSGNFTQLGNSHLLRC